MRALILSLLFLTSLCSKAQTLLLENDPSRFVENIIKDKTFGGVSGIEYVQDRNKWYLITDGDGDGRPSYLYEIDGAAKDSYPDWSKVKAGAVKKLTQAEAIRFDGRQFWILTEQGFEPGMPNPNKDFEFGSISVMSQSDGKWSMGKSAFNYTSNLNNRGHEALALAGKDTICTISEWPLLKDAGYARLKLITCPDGACKTIAEYAYELDINSCIIDSAKVDGSFGNGISEMLYVGNGRFVMMERCFYNKVATVKLYETRITPEATNILASDFKPLSTAAPFRPLPKQEIFNFSSIKGVKIDNLEGMAWGPDHQSIAIISDNNFDSVKQKTQFILLKVIK